MQGHRAALAVLRPDGSGYDLIMLERARRRDEPDGLAFLDACRRSGSRLPVIFC